VRIQFGEHVLETNYIDSGGTDVAWEKVSLEAIVKEGTLRNAQLEIEVLNSNLPMKPALIGRASGLRLDGPAARLGRPVQMKLALSRPGKGPKGMLWMSVRGLRCCCCCCCCYSCCGDFVLCPTLH